MNLRTTLSLISVGLVAALLALAIPICGCGSTTTTAELFVQQTIHTPLEAFKLQVGRFPTTAEGLEALFKSPSDAEGKWQGPYIESMKVPIDPWGQPYRYQYPAARSSRPYDIWSLGPDRVPSADDIGNWQKKT